MADLESERAHHYELTNRPEPDPCYRCGEAYEDHRPTTSCNDCGSMYLGITGRCRRCNSRDLDIDPILSTLNCPGYLAPDTEQDAEDAAIARWERDHER